MTGIYIKIKSSKFVYKQIVVYNVESLLKIDINGFGVCFFTIYIYKFRHVVKDCLYS